MSQELNNFIRYSLIGTAGIAAFMFLAFIHSHTLQGPMYVIHVAIQSGVKTGNYMAALHFALLSLEFCKSY